MNEEIKAILQTILERIELSDAKNEARFKALSMELTGVKSELTEFKEEVNQRFDQVDQRFNHVDRHLRLIESDFDLMNQRTANNEREIARIKKIVEG